MIFRKGASPRARRAVDINPALCAVVDVRTTPAFPAFPASYTPSNTAERYPKSRTSRCDYSRRHDLITSRLTALRNDSRRAREVAAARNLRVAFRCACTSRCTPGRAFPADVACTLWRPLGKNAPGRRTRECAERRRFPRAPRRPRRQRLSFQVNATARRTRIISVHLMAPATYYRARGRLVGRSDVCDRV